LLALQTEKLSESCCTKAQQGETGCKGRTVPMEKLDSVVAEHIEHRLLQPKRLEEVLSAVLHRRKERAERRTTHIAELRKRAAEAEAKLKRLYDAIENGIADVSDQMLKERVIELKAIRDQPRADADRAGGALDRLGPSIFASEARRRMRTETGGYRRDHLRALVQRVEVDAKKFVSWGRKACSCARSSRLRAQKRRVLECPVLYALPERGVTVHSGDMGYTMGPFAGSAECPGRCGNPWMSV
jgi:site-specific DNA recombinase